MSLRWWTRLRAAVTVMVILVVAGAGAAVAAEEHAAPGASMLDIFGVTTSDGTRLSQWELPLTTRYEVFGKDLPDPFLMFINIGWYLYRILVGFSLWYLKQAQGGSWRVALVDLTESTVTPLFVSIADLNLPAIAGTFAFILVAWAWGRGRTGASLAEAGMVTIMYALAVGVLASPVVKLTEPGGGIDNAFTLARGVTSDLGKGTGDGGAKTEQRLADIMVANPAQMMAFGELLPEKCSGELTSALQEDATDHEAVRDKVTDCDDRYEEQPPLEVVFGVGLFTLPFLSTLQLTILSLTALMIFLVAVLVWLAIEVAWYAIWAPFPGRARMNLFNTGVKILLALTALVISLIAASVLSQGLVELFDSVRGDKGGLIDTFRAYSLASCISSLLWIVLWWKILSALLRSRRSSRKSIEKIATPVKPTTMPSASGAPLARIGSTAAQVGGHAIGARLGTGSRPNAEGTPQAPGPQAPAMPTGPSPQPRTPAPTEPDAEGLKKKVAVGTVAKIGGRAALGVMTGGSSTFADLATSSASKTAAQAGLNRFRDRLGKAREGAAVQDNLTRDSDGRHVVRRDAPRPGTPGPVPVPRVFTNPQKETTQPLPRQPEQRVDEPISSPRPTNRPTVPIPVVSSPESDPTDLPDAPSSAWSSVNPAPAGPAPEMPLVQQQPGAKDNPSEVTPPAPPSSSQLHERLYGDERPRDALTGYPDALSSVL